MKKNLLKQSVIAVLVGGALSASAFAANNDLENKVNKQGAAISEIAKVLVGDENNSDNPGLINLVDDLATDVEDNTAAIDENSEGIVNLEKAVTELGELTNTAIKNLGDEVTELDSNLKDTQDAVGANNLRLDKAESDIADLRNIQAYQDLDEVRKLVKGTETHLEEHISNEFSDLIDNVVDIEGAVERNTSRITETRNKQLLQNARLNNHSDRIGANETAIATNKTAIATNKAAIEANAANITAHTATIATHTQRLDNLDNRVNNLNKDLKRGLASQAALNGLFQPYNVGKLNLTAAVGGYKSQTAVAVGTGYRYNENIATKAGVAFTRGGSATYNVGVNFEW